MKSGLKVLIIDDDPDVSDFITITFEKIPGALVHVAHELEDAKIFLNEPLDLIILDLMMPGTSGFDICRKLRQNPIHQHTKILAITGYDTPEYREKILACGANTYLAKPFTIEELRQRLESLIPESL